MRPLFSHLRDTVDGTVGNIWRIVAGANRVKDAVYYSIPGYYGRPSDEDDSIGREDCLHMESGNERIVFATRNAGRLQRVLDYLSRDRDKGEVLFSTEDGTARSLFTLRPDGQIHIKMDNGETAPNDKAQEIWLDPVTGNVDITPTGTTPGLIRLGGAGATYHLIREETLNSWWSTAMTGVAALILGHIHTDSMAGPTTGPEQPPPAPPGTPLVLPPWPSCQCASPRGD